MEVEIRENLARQITDREPDSRSRKKKAFGFRKSGPILSLPFNCTVLGRVVSYDFLAEPKKFPLIVSLVLSVDDMENLREKEIPIDTHEKPLYIELQDIGILRVIGGCLSYETVDSPDSEERPLSLATAV